MTEGGTPLHPVLERERAHHEKLHSGFARRHFREAAVRAFRVHLLARILRLTGAGLRARILSLGCGIGDLELLLAPRVAEVVGLDLCPSAIRQAREDAARAGIPNARFHEAALPDLPPGLGRFDLALGIFLLHHLPDHLLATLPERLRGVLSPGGCVYTLDPRRGRLTAALGRRIVPALMRRYRSPDERELDPGETTALFRRGGFACRAEVYDILSTPLAGLLPSWRAGYRAARLLDDALIRLPGLGRLGSNFEIVARLDGPS